MTCQFTKSAGEDIRYLPRDLAAAEGVPSHDYWLFDSRTLVKMHFDDEDRFLGGEVRSGACPQPQSQSGGDQDFRCRAVDFLARRSS